MKLKTKYRPLALDFDAAAVFSPDKPGFFQCGAEADEADEAD